MGGGSGRVRDRGQGRGWLPAVGRPPAAEIGGGGEVLGEATARGRKAWCPAAPREGDLRVVGSTLGGVTAEVPACNLGRLVHGFTPSILLQGAAEPQEEGGGGADTGEERTGAGGRGGRQLGAEELDFRLEPVWASLSHASERGTAIGVDVAGGAAAHVFYVPYLSAVQLFDYGRGARRLGGGAVADSDDTEGGRAGGGAPHLLYEFKDARSMQERKPLAATVLDLAEEPASRVLFPHGHPLLHARASELHPASWFSIAWCPSTGAPAAAAAAAAVEPSTKFLAYYRPTKAALYALDHRAAAATVATQLRPVGLVGFPRPGDLGRGDPPHWTAFDGVSCWRVPAGAGQREAASRRHAELEAALERGALDVVASMRGPSRRTLPQDASPAPPPPSDHPDLTLLRTSAPASQRRPPVAVRPAPPPCVPALTRLPALPRALPSRGGE